MCPCAEHDKNQWKDTNTELFHASLRGISSSATSELTQDRLQIIDTVILPTKRSFIFPNRNFHGQFIFPQSIENVPWKCTQRPLMRLRADI